MFMRENVWNGWVEEEREKKKMKGRRVIGEVILGQRKCYFGEKGRNGKEWKNKKIKMRKRNNFNTKQREHENKIVCLIHNTLDVESNYLALTPPI